MSRSDKANERTRQQSTVHIVQSTEQPDKDKDALTLQNASRRNKSSQWLIACFAVFLVALIALFFSNYGALVLLLIVPCILMRKRSQKAHNKTSEDIKEIVRSSGLDAPDTITSEEVPDARSTATLKTKYATTLPVPTKDKGGIRYWWWNHVNEKKFERTGNVKYLIKPSVTNRIAQLDSDIRANALLIARMFIVTLNQKGGSCKTTIAAMLAVFYAWITQGSTLLLDSNQAMGTTADAVGSTDAPSVDQAVDDYLNNPGISPSYRGVVYGHHPCPGYGSLRVLRSVTDDERAAFLANKGLHEGASIHSRLAYGKFNEEEYLQNSATIADNGNSLNQPIVKATTDTATAGILTAKGTDASSIKLCRDTLQYYRRTMQEFAAKRCIVVISAVADYTDEWLRAAYAVFFEIDPARVMFAEFDNGLAIDRNKRLTPQQITSQVMPYVVVRQSRRNQCAWREVLLAVQKLHLDKKLDYTPPGPTDSGFDGQTTPSPVPAINLRGNVLNVPLPPVGNVHGPTSPSTPPRRYNEDHYRKP